MDWSYVGWSASWIIGLSLELTVLSIAYYLSGERHQKLGQVIGGRGFQLSLDLGMVFFCLGLAALAGSLWQRIAWSVLCAGFAVNLIYLLLKKRGNEQS